MPTTTLTSAQALASTPTTPVHATTDARTTNAPAASRAHSPNAGAHRRTIRRSFVAALVALAVAVSGCASAEAPDGADEPRTGGGETSVTSTTNDTGPDPDPAPLPVPDEEEPVTDHLDVAVVARALHDLEVYDGPGGTPIRTLPGQTDFGSTTVALVLAAGTGADEGWLEVVLPGRPNGATGWVQADDVELRELDVEVHVDLAARELTVHLDGDVVLTTEVAIGDDEHPTPTGRFFVTDKLDTEDPDGAYGPYAIGLSGRSEVLTEFAGGDGQIGIHGTNDPTSIGEAVSHGCVRVPNSVVRELVALLPLGTPVVIS